MPYYRLYEILLLITLFLLFITYFMAFKFRYYFPKEGKFPFIIPAKDMNKLKDNILNYNEGKSTRKKYYSEKDCLAYIFNQLLTNNRKAIISSLIENDLEFYIVRCFLNYYKSIKDDIKCYSIGKCIYKSLKGSGYKITINESNTYCQIIIECDNRIDLFK